MEIHPNVIIRKKIKSKAKLGKMLLEIMDEIEAGVYPSMTHAKRLKKNGIHQYTWDESFLKITKKKGKEVHIKIDEFNLRIIKAAKNVVTAYKALEDYQKAMVDAIILSLLRE